MPSVPSGNNLASYLYIEPGFGASYNDVFIKRLQIIT